MLFRFHPFLRHARKKALVSDEKNVIRTELTTFMHAHPVRAGTEARLLERRLLPSLMPFMAVALLLLLGMGTVSAAERALPTHPLYPLKLYVNEPLRRVLTRTPEEKTKLDEQFLLRRREEIHALQEKKVLPPHVQKRLEKRIEREVKRLEARSEQAHLKKNPSKK